MSLHENIVVDHTASRFVHTKSNVFRHLASFKNGPMEQAHLGVSPHNMDELSIDALLVRVGAPGQSSTP